MIKLAVVGTGGMANAHARSFQAIRGVKIVAACDVIPEKVAAFAERYAIPETYTDVEELLAMADVDAVTNVTPDAFHARVALAVIKRGKHILSEKPLATCYADAKKMADAAARKGVINMVNLSYRNSSAIHRAAKLVRAGPSARVMHLEASYLQGWLGSMYWGDWKAGPGTLWRLSTRHGSKGVLGDIGVHILDFATYPAGDIASVNCRLKTFHKAKGDRIGEYPLDANDSAVITVELAGGAIGTIHTTRWAVGHAELACCLRIYGDKGAIARRPGQVLRRIPDLPGQGHPQGAVEDDQVRADAQHLPALHQEHPDGQERSARLRPRRRHPEGDGRLLRVGQEGQGGEGLRRPKGRRRRLVTPSPSRASRTAGCSGRRQPRPGCRGTRQS